MDEKTACILSIAGVSIDLNAVGECRSKKLASVALDGVIRDYCAWRLSKSAKGSSKIKSALFRLCRPLAVHNIPEARWYDRDFNSRAPL